MIDFPPLVLKNRIREFNSYTEEERSAIVYHYLVEGMTNRDLDEKILGKNRDYYHGFQSMGILHYLGLNNSHKGIFRNCTPVEMLQSLIDKCLDPSFCVIYYYLLEYIKKHIPSFVKDEVNDIDIYPEDIVKGQSWIRNTLINNTNASLIDTKLTNLSDDDNKIVINKVTCYYSSAEIKESIKSLYDYRCQICGEVIYRVGWKNTFKREDQWKFMSADVHHILPLSKHGPDKKDNMICLCPTCHRKFHSGEFRLQNKNKNIILSDELLGFKKPVFSLKHVIHLY